MNVLITSAGRRVTLLKAFKTATNKRGGELLAGDIDNLAPALYFADRGLELPRISDKKYLGKLLDLIDQYTIRLIVPTIDTELPVLSQHQDTFVKMGCRALISSPELVSTMQDKWMTVNYFRDHDIRTPCSWLPDEIMNNLPEEIFIKPREGSASQNTYRAHKSELASLISKVPNPIIQEYLDYPEITVDSLIDFKGQVIHFVPRKRIRTIGGESIQGMTMPDTELREWLVNVLKIISASGGRGPMTLQAFLSPEGPILSEVNPRFGGGFPLAMAAGALYPEWILQMLEGRVMEPRIGNYQTNLYMTRYFSEVIVEHPLLEVKQ